MYIYLGQDSIDFCPYETPCYPNAPIIRKGKYPKLFKQGTTGFNALHAEYFKDSKEGGTYIKFSNKQPDHAGFWDTYGILVDPFTGMVKESKSIVDGLASF